MHTSNYEHVEDNEKYYATVHHNGDFSGNVIIQLDKHDFTRVDYDNPVESTTMVIPFDIIKELVADYVRDKRSAELEDMDADEIFKS